jgi:hypothetical protein
MAKYRVLQGIDYPPNKRAEIGDVVEDLPAAAIKWLLESGAIEDSSKPAKKIEEPTPEPIAEPVVEAPVEVVPEPETPELTDEDDD